MFCVHLFTLNIRPASQPVGLGGTGLQNLHLFQAVRSGPVISPDITIMSLSVHNFCIYLSTYIFKGLLQYSELRLCSCALPEVGLGSSQTDVKPLGAWEACSRDHRAQVAVSSLINLLDDFLFSV